MSDFVKGLTGLFGGGGTSTVDASLQNQQIEKSRNDQTVALERQRQQLQEQQAEQDKQAGRATRQPRGRRLLLAATGEAGLSNTLG